jgi:hypothetical protein
MRTHRRSNPRGIANGPIRTGAGNYRKPNPRGCPGSYARVRGTPGELGVCPFCNNDFRISKNGTLRAHVRPS